MKSSFLFIFFILPSFNFLSAQEVIFKNPGNNPRLDLLDTSVIISNRLVNIDIGPEHRENRNTIFFNKPFQLTNDKIQTFHIKGSFLQHMIIDSCEFKQPNLYIDSTNFDTLFINKCTIIGDVIFNNVIIKNFRFTNNNNFSGKLIFNNCEFENIDIEKASFWDSILFRHCIIGNIKAKGAGFKKTVNLSGNTLNGMLDFNAAIFMQSLNLSSLKARPETKLSFVGTVMPDTLDFSQNSSIIDSINFANILYGVLNRKCRLLLHGTDVSRFRINYHYYELVFPHDISMDEKENIYEALLLNLKNNSYQQSYKQLDIEYKRFEGKQGTFPFLYWVPEAWDQFGYDKPRVFKIAFWSLLIFCFINYFLLNYMMQVYIIKSIPAYYRKHDRFRVWYAIVFTCLIFFSLYLKVDRIKFSKGIGAFYLITLYVFGIICLAYMANYLIKR